MVTKTKPLLFSAENLNCLFPFHVLINSDLIIEASGSSMIKLCGNYINKPFTECFQLMRPVEENLNFMVINRLVNKLLLFKVTSLQNSIAIVKGQFTFFENKQKLLFTGTPWFNSIEELRSTNLMISDFPHNNPTVDLLHMLKTQEIINQDLEQLIITINEQKNKLKIGEKQILISLQKERELSLLKSNFVSFASHEFRTPLACIRSSVELTQLTLSKPAPQFNNITKHQNNILSEVDQLCELIDEVLIVGKIESNNFLCKKESTDLLFVLRKIIKNIDLIQDDNRSVTLITSKINQIIMADPLLLNHIFNNLISNSLKYSKGEKQPVITIKFTDKEVHLKIKDFGIGIPLQQQPKIFQAFFRADNVNQIAGTGLGLFITKNFIALHGGQISFKSIPKKGTEFLMTLPIV